MGYAVPVKAEIWPCLLWVFFRPSHPQQSSIPLSLGTCRQLRERLAIWRPCEAVVGRGGWRGEGPSAKGALVFLLMLSVRMGGPEGFC